MRVQVVDVVEADISGEPLQDARHAEIGRAAQRRRHEGPLRLPQPDRRLEAVLHREDPHAHNGRDDHDWHMHGNHALESEQ
jgi:hypothetical protein